MKPGYHDILIATLQPLVNIANAYDANELDDGARRFWGPEGNRTENTINPSQILIYTGRGGRTLLTLLDCQKARDAQALLRTITLNQ